MNNASLDFHEKGLSLRHLNWKPSHRPSFLKSLASWLPYDAHPQDIFRQKIWEEPDFDSQLSLVLESEGRWLGFAMGVLREDPAKQKKGFIKILALAPEVRGLGLGYRLVKLLEQRLFLLGALSIRLGESAPNYLWPGLDPRYTRAFLLFQNMGYAQVGQTFNLRVDLRKPLPKLKVQSPLGIETRRALPEDGTALAAWLHAHWPTWVQEVWPAVKKSNPSVFLAVHGSAIIGFAAYECQNRGMGWFGPMGTMPGYEGKGVGTLLCRRVLAAMAEEGFPQVVIPWVGPVGFYEKAVGAQIHRVFFRMQKLRPVPK